MCRFLHKAAILMPGEIPRSGSWKLCSVSEVESAKALLRLVPITCCFIMCGVVSSTANTYFVEQASHMNFNIGKWKPPFQLMLLISFCGKFIMVIIINLVKKFPGKGGTAQNCSLFCMYSVACCAAAAAVERRRLGLLKGHDLLDLPDDGKVPMSAAWLFFQIGLAGMMEPFSEYGFSAFFKVFAPKSMKRYHDCYVEGVTGYGFLYTALSVYVVGKVSEAGGGKNWFQFALNQSRLDRYYWVLTALCALNFLVCVCAVQIYMDKNMGLLEFLEYLKHIPHNQSGDGEIWSIKKGSALELVLRHYKVLPQSVVLCLKNCIYGRNERLTCWFWISKILPPVSHI